MNLRPLYLFFCAVAIGFGVFLGWQDAQRERGDVSDDGAPGGPRWTQASGSPASGSPASGSPASGGELPGGSSRTDGSLSAPDGSAAGRNGAETSSSSAAPRVGDGSSDAARDPASSPGPQAPTESERREIAEISDLLRDHRFEEARSRARDLVRDSATSARERAEELAARALVFERLVPERAAQASVEAAREVLLANRNTLVAIELEETAVGYQLKTASGTTVRLRHEDVLEVRPVDAKSFQREQEERIARRVRALENPIDIYLRGVRKYYQLGLREEGDALLESLLKQPEGEQVAIVIGGDRSDELLAAWRVASGRRRAPASAASATEIASAASGTANPGGSEASASATRTPPPSAPLSPATLSDLESRLGEALTLYRSARGKESREKDLKQAYDTLLSLQERLYALPETSEVESLRRKVGIAIYDVYKSSPFLDEL